MEFRSKGELKVGERILHIEKRHGLYLSKCPQCDQMQVDCEVQNIVSVGDIIGA
jgi:hypothetical protein